MKLPEEDQNNIAEAVAAGEDVKSEEIKQLAKEKKEEEHCKATMDQFFAVWFLLALPAITLDDWLRWRIFGEEKPKYYMTFGKNNFECAAMSANGICKRHIEACEGRETCKSRNSCGECKNYMIPKGQEPCKSCKNIRG